MNNNNIWKTVEQSNDIVGVISEYCNLIKNGKNYKAPCPFHDEKTASFIVSPEKQIFTCFGCKKSGSVIRFIEFKKNISAFEALKLLAARANIDISKYDKYSNTSVKTERQLSLIEINAAANTFFQYQYHKQKESNNINLLNVINSRKLEQLDIDIVKHFQIGYSDEDISINEYLQKKGFAQNVIANSSLTAFEKEHRNFFNNRLIFPIYNDDLNCVGFSGRTVVNDEIKYLNTSENEIFKKHSLFFNWQNVKEKLIKDNEVYIVEGQFDVIALYRIGIENAIAVMGTSLTEFHLKMLQKCTINLFYDGDKAGKAATVKSLNTLLKFKDRYKYRINIIDNNSPADPDELFNAMPNGEALKTIIKNKINYLDYIYNSTVNKDTNSFEESIQNINQFNQYLTLLNQTERDVLSKRALDDKKIYEDSLIKNVNQNDQPIDYGNYFIQDDLLLNTTKLRFTKTRLIKTKNNKSKQLIKGSHSYYMYSILKTILSQPLFLKELLNRSNNPSNDELNNLIFLMTSNHEPEVKQIIQKSVSQIKANNNSNLKINVEEFSDEISITNEISQNIEQVTGAKSADELYEMIKKINQN
ncbi:DNA primase [Mycoplasma phocoenae]|uniref:DNA primase n=1 Tax=Mycoplasma phocoenae TaxID=754517 RepID=A0A858U760_9MOLU|nr:DNA primase [Mycoplasma phocoenae]QJG67073.1 DNA primase [Mycoplasma phocoenae]